MSSTGEGLKSLNVYIDPKLRADLDTRREREGRTLRSVVEGALRLGLAAKVRSV